MPCRKENKKPFLPFLYPPPIETVHQPQANQIRPQPDMLLPKFSPKN